MAMVKAPAAEVCLQVDVTESSHLGKAPSGAVRVRKVPLGPSETGLELDVLTRTLPSPLLISMP